MILQAEAVDTNQPPLKIDNGKLSFADALRASTSSHPALPSKAFSHLFQTASPNPIAQKTPCTHHGEIAVMFSQQEINTLASPFQFALVGKFSKGRPPLEDIRKFFKTLKLKGEVQTSLLDFRHILVRCNLEADFLRLWSHSIWYVHGLAMRIFKWNHDFHVDKESSLVPIWFSLPKLPIHFFDQAALFAIVSNLGRPLLTDSATSSLVRTNVARVQIEIDLRKSLPSRVWIGCGDEDGFWQDLIPESLPKFCVQCSRVGHTSEECKRGSTGKFKGKEPQTNLKSQFQQQVYRPKPKTPLPLGDQEEKKSAGHSDTECRQNHLVPVAGVLREIREQQDSQQVQEENVESSIQVKKSCGCTSIQTTEPDQEEDLSHQMIKSQVEDHVNPTAIAENRLVRGRNDGGKVQLQMRRVYPLENGRVKPQKTPSEFIEEDRFIVEDNAQQNVVDLSVVTKQGLEHDARKLKEQVYRVESREDDQEMSCGIISGTRENGTNDATGSFRMGCGQLVHEKMELFNNTPLKMSPLKLSQVPGERPWPFRMQCDQKVEYFNNTPLKMSPLTLRLSPNVLPISDKIQNVSPRVVIRNNNLSSENLIGSMAGFAHGDADGTIQFEDHVLPSGPSQIVSVRHTLLDKCVVNPLLAADCENINDQNYGVGGMEEINSAADKIIKQIAGQVILEEESSAAPISEFSVLNDGDSESPRQDEHPLEIQEDILRIIQSSGLSPRRAKFLKGVRCDSKKELLLSRLKPRRGVFLSRISSVTSL